MLAVQAVSAKQPLKHFAQNSAFGKIFTGFGAKKHFDFPTHTATEKALKKSSKKLGKKDRICIAQKNVKFWYQNWELVKSKNTDRADSQLAGTNVHKTERW